MAENQNNLYQSKSAIANKFLNPNGETSTLDEIITQVVPGATSAETTSTPTKEYQSKPAVANKFLNTDGTYSTLDEILGRTIGGIGQFDVEVVEELPEVGEKGILYLVPNEGSGRDIYDEYVWIPSIESFERIGTTEIDLSNYEQLTNKVTTITSDSTDTQYPSARAVYDALAGKPGSTDVIKVTNAYAYGVNNSSVPVLYKNGVETPMAEGQWYLVESFTAPLTSRPIDEPTIVRYYINSLTNIPTVIKLSATTDADHSYAVNWYTTYTYENNEWVMHVSNVLESSFNKTTSINDLSTDDQYPSAKAVYDNLELKTNHNNVAKDFWYGTQAEYEALATKDPTTIYMTDEDTTMPIATTINENSTNNEIASAKAVYDFGIPKDTGWVNISSYLTSKFSARGRNIKCLDTVCKTYRKYSIF
jgi:hypothetical protein